MKYNRREKFVCMMKRIESAIEPNATKHFTNKDK